MRSVGGWIVVRDGIRRRTVRRRIGIAIALALFIAMNGTNLVDATVLSPRFDTVGIAVWNSIAIAFFIYALVRLVVRERSPEPAPIWMWLVLLLNVSYGGAYGPIGPIIVVLSLPAPRSAPSANPLVEQHTR